MSGAVLSNSTPSLLITAETFVQSLQLLDMQNNVHLGLGLNLEFAYYLKSWIFANLQYLLYHY